MNQMRNLVESNENNSYTHTVVRGRNMRDRKLEERYETHGRYVKELEAAAERLASERLLLPEDAIAYVEAAKTRDLGLLQ
jgi:Alpha/beta hydrolase domain